MFKTATTVIIGAGASFEVGLPVGDGLMVAIQGLLQPSQTNQYGFSNPLIARAIQHKVGFHPDGGFSAAQRWREAANRICIGLQYHQSIDNLLHFLHDDEDATALGKLAITMCIADYEQKSYFFRDDGTGQVKDFATPRITKGIQQSWYVPFAKKLLSEHSRSQIEQVFGHVTFIIFNYDRCVEQYLSMMIRDTCNLRSSSEVGTLMSGAKFIHPYGSLGPLPWQVDKADTALPFGQAGEANFWELSKNIKTFTETVESQISKEIKTSVRCAHTLILLGFGYNDQNMDLLSPGESASANRILATALGKFGEEELSIRNAIARLSSPYAPRIMIDNGTCRQMFDRLQVTLNAA